MKAFVDSERCKSCELCIGNCPKAAIQMTDELNSRGYKHVKVIKANCIGCGICYTVCPDGVFSILEEV